MVTIPSNISAHLQKTENGETRLYLTTNASDGSIVDVAARAGNKKGIRAYKDGEAFFAKLIGVAKDIVFKGQKFTVNKKSFDQYMIRITTGEDKIDGQKKVERVFQTAFKQQVNNSPSQGSNAEKAGLLLQAHVEAQASRAFLETGSETREKSCSPYTSSTPDYESQTYWNRLFSFESGQAQIELTTSGAQTKGQVLTLEELQASVDLNTNATPKEKASLKENIAKLYDKAPKHLFKPGFKNLWETQFSTPGLTSQYDFAKMIEKADQIDEAIEMGYPLEAKEPKVQIATILLAGLPEKSPFRTLIQNSLMTQKAAQTKKKPVDPKQKEKFLKIAGRNTRLREELEPIYEAAPKDLFGPQELPIWSALLSATTPLSNRAVIGDFDFEDMWHEADRLNRLAPSQRPEGKGAQIYSIINRASFLGPHANNVRERFEILNRA